LAYLSSLHGREANAKYVRDGALVTAPVGVNHEILGGQAPVQTKKQYASFSVWMVPFRLRFGTGIRFSVTLYCRHL